MPIYEYTCAKCDNEFEVEQRITDEPVKTCPACRSRKVKRLISQTSFVLKGGGWYADLYSSKRGKDGAAEAPAEKPKESAAPSEAKPEAGSESKPARKGKQKDAKAAA
jgi:putative FmdB family regulatory protein